MQETKYKSKSKGPSCAQNGKSEPEKIHYKIAKEKKNGQSNGLKMEHSILPARTGSMQNKSLNWICSSLDGARPTNQLQH